jgi:hypothetical protein
MCSHTFTDTQTEAVITWAGAGIIIMHSNITASETAAVIVADTQGRTIGMALLVVGTTGSMVATGAATMAAAGPEGFIRATTTPLPV